MQNRYLNYFSIFPNLCSSHCPSLVSPPYASSTRSLANDRVSDLLGCCCPQMSSTQSVSPVHGLSTQVHIGPPPPPSPRPPPCPTPCPVIIVHILIHLNAIRIPCPKAIPAESARLYLIQRDKRSGAGEVQSWIAVSQVSIFIFQFCKSISNFSQGSGHLHIEPPQFPVTVPAFHPSKYS